MWRRLGENRREIAGTVKIDDGLHGGGLPGKFALVAFQFGKSIGDSDQRREMGTCRRSGDDETVRRITVLGGVGAKKTNGALMSWICAGNRAAGDNR